ncbi:MAG: hypothetical protein J6S71_04085 [Clostridia bacterium]|nr:hypothetical protein [Clostridia bacterium]
MKINFERLKYSPFGKNIIKTLKFRLIQSVCLSVPMLVFGFLSFAGSLMMGITVMLVFGGLACFFLGYTIRDTLIEAQLLSAMTDEEHNTLIKEYQKYEERNIIRYGHLTSYGLVLETHILPWKNIKSIEFVPGEYRYVYRKHGSYLKYFPAKITVTSKFGEKTVKTAASIVNEDYDLSDEISRFLESIPKYTEHKFEVINGYYYAK